MTSMPTVVLDHSGPRAAAPPSASPLGAPPTLASSTAAAGVAKVKSLARSARAIAQRAAAKIEAQQSLFARPVEVSSTAKTQDLSGKAKAVAQATPVAAPSKSESISNNVRASSKDIPSGTQTASSKAVAAPSGRPLGSSGISSGASSGTVSGTSSEWTATGKKAGQNGAARAPSDPQINAGAWLVASGSVARFGLAQSRTIVGRALDGEEPDIDLGTLKAIADRVSRRHAEIIKHGADYFIRDLGSLNGTYITGRGRLGRDQLYKLKDRDQIVFGSAKLEFRKG
jgi:hypothetical protein